MNFKAEVANAAYGTGYLVLAFTFSLTVMAAVTAASAGRALRQRQARQSPRPE